MELGGAIELHAAFREESRTSLPSLERFRNYCGPIKVARSGFPCQKTTKGGVAPPGFLRAALTEGNDVLASFTESRMQFDGTTKLHRKSGFGLHQLRNRCIRRRRLSVDSAVFGIPPSSEYSEYSKPCF